MITLLRMITLSLLIFLAHYTTFPKGGPAPDSGLVRNGRVIKVFLRKSKKFRLIFR